MVFDGGQDLTAAFLDDWGAGGFRGDDAGQKLVDVREMLAARVVEEIEELEQSVVQGLGNHFLRGGANLAVATSLGQLRAGGALDAQARPVGPSMSKDPLDTALLHALAAAGRKGKNRQVTKLARGAAVRPVLDALQTDELFPCNWQKGQETLHV